MTISTTNITKSYNGNGSTHSFAYDFPIFADADLSVIVRSSTGGETTKTLNTHYVVTGAGASSGGNVLFKFNTGTSSDAHYSLTDQRPASGETVVIRSELSNTQTLDLVANDPFPASSFETALDRLVRMVQQHDEELDRSIKLSRTNTMTSTEFTNSATDRASKILAFDSTGELSVTTELGTFKGNWAASTTYALRDIVKDTSTNNIFIATTAHTSSGAQPLTTNTDSAKWSLLVDAASATTSQTAAAGSATTAGNAQTAAEDARDLALSYRNTAETHKNDAETAKTDAETALATFQGQYHGAASSDPSSNLNTGDLYFNTSTGVKVYNGSAWVDVKPSSSEQTAITAVNANATNINTLAAADVLADMALLANADVISDMNTLATTDVIADLNTLATSDIVSDINTLATSDIVSDLNTLATSDIVSDLNTLATSSIVSDLNTVAGSIENVNLTGGSIENVNLTGGSIENVNSVADALTNIATTATNISGVNSFAERYRVSSSDPTSSLDEGDLAYNSTANQLKYYDGSAWQGIAPGISAVSGDSSPSLGGNLNVNGNSIVSASNGNIAITPNGSGDVILDGLKYPQADGSNGQFLKTDGSGQLSFGTVSTPSLASLSIANHDQVTVTSGGAVTATSYAGDGSALTGIVSFASGTKMLFGQTAAPTGWTKITTNDDAALRIVSGTVGTGGSSGLSTALATPTVTGTIAGSTGAHTLTIAEMPSHTHDMWLNEGLYQSRYGPGNAYNNNNSRATGAVLATGGGGSHSHSLSATFSGGTAAINVKYVDAIMASKD